MLVPLAVTLRTLPCDRKPPRGVPVGSFVELGRVCQEDQKTLPVRALLPFAELEDLRFEGWDIFPDSLEKKCEI